MTERVASATDGEVELFKAGRGWAFVTTVTQADGLSLRSDSDWDTADPFAESHGYTITRLFRGSGNMIFLDDIPDGATVDCFVGSLPERLNCALDAGQCDLKSATAKLIGMICLNSPAEPAMRGLPNDRATFDLLRCCAAVARRLGRFEKEVILIEKSLEIRPSQNLKRLLAYAYANAQDYPRAIVAAERALEADPNLASGSFQDHLAELRSYSEIGKELQNLVVRRAPVERATSRIAYCLHNALPYRHGGYAMRSHSLSMALIDAGHDLVAFARPGFPSDGAYPPVHCSGLEVLDSVPYRFENRFGRRGRAYGYIAEAADYYEKSFVEHKIGLVQAASNFWTALPSLIAARRLGLPFIYEVRSFWAITREARLPGFVNSPQARRDEALEAIVLSLADAIVTLNEPMRARLAGSGLAPKKIGIVPNCVDSLRYAPRPRDHNLLEKYGVQPDNLVIGYMGAMLGYEGIDLLIEAVAPLFPDHPNLKVLIVGADPKMKDNPGSIEIDLLRRIDRLGLDGKVILADRVVPEETAAIYQLFDICAYPRRGLEVCELVSPLKPLEAMAAGKALIGSNVGGLLDMITPNRTGLVFAKDNIRDLRSELRRLVNDRALRETLGSNAQAYVDNERSWQSAVSIMDEIYRRLSHRIPFDASNLADCIASHFQLAETSLFGPTHP